MKRLINNVKKTSRRIRNIARLLWSLPDHIDTLDGLEACVEGLVDHARDMESNLTKCVNTEDLDDTIEKIANQAIHDYDFSELDVDSQIESWIDHHLDHEELAADVASELDMNEIMKRVLQALAGCMREAAREIA